MDIDGDSDEVRPEKLSGQVRIWGMFVLCFPFFILKLFCLFVCLEQRKVYRRVKQGEWVACAQKLQVHLFLFLSRYGYRMKLFLCPGLYIPMFFCFLFFF